MTNKIFVISAPSGTGKSTIVRAVRSVHPELIAPVSCTTRPPRPRERDGIDYYFRTEGEFEALKNQNAFVETVYLEPYFYGSLFSEYEKAGSSPIITDVNINGALALINRFPDRVILIMLVPPSVEELERRLRDRADTPEKEIPLRLARTSEELAAAEKFDYVVVNDDLDTAVSEVLAIIQDHIMK